MGIGASYYGPDGGRRTFSLDGIPEPGTAVADFLGASAPQLPHFGGAGIPLSMPSPPVPEIPSMADDTDAGKVKVTAGDMPDVLANKILPNGSITTSGNMLCLVGEEGGTPGGKKVYGSADGMKGFLSLSQIDPYAGGTPLVGTGDTANGAMANLDGRSGASIRIGGRSHVTVDIDPKGKRWLVVKDFYRMADITPNGRIARISGEIEVLVAKVLLGGVGGGEGEGKYGVRPFFVNVSGDPVHPIPDAFAFGPEAALDTWNEGKSRFDCNYDENDVVLEYPPVKVVAVAACPGGMPEEWRS